MVTFKVIGKGHFPMDMLRYDGCYPVDPGSVQRLEGNGEERTVTLRTHSHVTHDRWASFGWSVQDEVVSL